MAPPCRRPRRSPPALMEELVEEILLRVPPDEPAHLIRAALVCKLWRRILSDRGFLRRFRAFHRCPPLLGYLHNIGYNKEGEIPPLVPTTVASPLSPPGFFSSQWWWALDCHHGRVLIQTLCPGYLVVWDPITGDQKRLSAPSYPHTYYAGAVLCAKHGCDHLDCHGGPFLVIYVGSSDQPGGASYLTRASIYSSETGVWSASVDIDDLFYYVEGSRPSLLIGNALYFPLQYGINILKFDLGERVLTEVEAPSVHGSIAMEIEDGVLGFVGELDNCICKWLWQTNADGTAGRWEQHMVLELETLLPRPAVHTSYEVVGLVEGTYTIFISGSVGVFTLDLKSRKVKKVVGESAAYYFVILPYRSFYTPDLVKGWTVTATEMQLLIN